MNHWIGYDLEYDFVQHIPCIFLSLYKYERGKMEVLVSGESGDWLAPLKQLFI